MTSSHTKRWAAFYDEVADEYEIGWKLPLGRRVIATVQCGFDEPVNTQQHKAAALIAAAPQLAEYIVHHYDGRRDHACEECCPEESIPAHLRGFRCAYHIGKAFLSDDEVTK